MRLLRRIERVELRCLSQRASVPKHAQKLDDSLRRHGASWHGSRGCRVVCSDESDRPQLLAKIVTVVGGGVAGMSAACALAEAGFASQLVERRGYLGGRASSYLHPGVGRGHRQLPACALRLLHQSDWLLPAHRRRGQIHWTSEMTMIEPGGRRSRLGPSQSACRRRCTACPASGAKRLHARRQDGAGPRLSRTDATGACRFNRDSGRVAHAQRADARRHQSLLAAGDCQRAECRCRRDRVALRGEGDSRTVSEFRRSRQHGHEHRAAERAVLQAPRNILRERGGEVVLNASVEERQWDEETSQWTLTTRDGDLRPISWCSRCRLRPRRNCCRTCRRQTDVESLPRRSRGRSIGQSAACIFGSTARLRISIMPCCSTARFTGCTTRAACSRRANERQLPGTGGQRLAQICRASREEAIEQAVRELAEFFPAVAAAKLEKAALVKEVRATFAVPPGIEFARPGSKSPWPNCLLAGDWIATGWPSTMESAARSGHLAAEAVCAAILASRRSFLASPISSRAGSCRICENSHLA